MTKFFVIIEDVGIEAYDKFSHVEKNHKLTKSDFVKHGDEYITHFNTEDYHVSKDIKLLETVATEKIFGNKKVDWLTAGSTAVVTLIAMLLFFG